MLAARTKPAGSFLIKQALGKPRESCTSISLPDLDLGKRVGNCTLLKTNGHSMMHLPSVFHFFLMPTSSRGNFSKIGLVAKKEQSSNISVRARVMGALVV
jgi:hypothetical protein